MFLFRYLDPGNNGFTVQQFYNRWTSFSQSGLPLTPSRILPNEPPAHYGPDQSTNDILRSISITISDVQMKLSSIEEKSRKHDEAFKHIEEALHHLQKSQSDHEQARMAKFKCKSHKSPRGLSVRKV